MRQIPIPKQLEIAEDYPALFHAIKKNIQSNSIERLLIITGTYSYNTVVKALLEDLHTIGIRIKYQVIDDFNLATINTDTNSDWVMSIGGGKILDYGKYLAAKTTAKFISVPTLISHDGICSPVAVLEGQSLPATMPQALIVPLYIIKEGPLNYIQAGVGDLISNLSAIEDWKLAAKLGQAEIDDFAVMLSKQAAMSVLNSLENNNLKDNNFLKTLIEALALSGIAMSISGNSRPCSGAEHMISHAIDDIYGHGTKAMHGIQVLVATLYLEKIRGYDLLTQNLLVENESSTLYKKLKASRFPVDFKDINIQKDELQRILELAPKTRPERTTILNQYIPL